MVNSQFVTDAELNSYINQSYFELYDLLIQKYGDNYYVKLPFFSFPADGITEFYPLPDDFYKLIGVNLVLSPGTPASRVTLKRFNTPARNMYSVPNFQSFYGVTNLGYQLLANTLWLTPIPAGNQVIEILYIPRLVALVADTDVADGFSGWLEYVIIDVAIKALNKEESDTSVLMARKQAMMMRIESAAENRDAANPMCVSDNMNNQYWWPAGGNGSGSF